MNPLFIHHHLGMGDHIICNGMIRTLLNDSESCTDVYVFSKESNAKRVSRMFEDDSRIHVVSIPTDQDEFTFVDKFGVRIMRCGFGDISKLQYLGLAKTFDEALYVSAGVPYENRWSAFYIRRDPAQEKIVLDKLNPTGEAFMFVHDDPSRGISFTPSNSNGLKIIRNDPSEDIFNMCLLLENAAEIHCMESSFRCLIEHLPLIKCPLFLHTGVRSDGHGSTIVSGSKRKWIAV
jgi:hypothetical protein